MFVLCITIFVDGLEPLSVNNNNNNSNNNITIFVDGLEPLSVNNNNNSNNNMLFVSLVVCKCVLKRRAKHKRCPVYRMRSEGFSFNSGGLGHISCRRILCVRWRWTFGLAV